MGNNKYGFKWGYSYGFPEMPCPKCGDKIDFHENGTIETNIYSEGVVRVEMFLKPWFPNICGNPTCEWSGAK